MIDKTEFLRFSDIMINGRGKMSDTSPTMKSYTKEKIIFLIDLFIELEKKSLIKKLSPEEKFRFDKEVNDSLQNIADLNKLRADYARIIKNRPPSNSDRIKFKDEIGNELEITMTQYVIHYGITYSALCELMKFIMVKIIDFDKITKKHMDGIGAIKKTLKENEFPIGFFWDIDNRLRNSFFHMDFVLKNEDNGRIYCDFTPEIYSSEPWSSFSWRKSEDNSQKDYIKITDLFWQSMNADLSTFALIGCFVYMMKII